MKRAHAQVCVDAWNCSSLERGVERSYCRAKQEDFHHSEEASLSASMTEGMLKTWRWQLAYLKRASNVGTVQPLAGEALS